MLMMTKYICQFPFKKLSKKLMFCYSFSQIYVFHYSFPLFDKKTEIWFQENYVDLFRFGFFQSSFSVKITSKDVTWPRAEVVGITGIGKMATIGNIAGVGNIARWSTTLKKGNWSWLVAGSNWKWIAPGAR